MRSVIVGTAAAAFAAALAAASPASAFVQESNRSFAEGYGNNNAYGGLSYASRQSNTSGTVGLPLPSGPGINIVPFLRSRASQEGDSTVKVFGKSVKPFTGSLAGEGYWVGDNTSGGTHTPSTSARLTVLGSTVFSSIGTACATGKRCLSGSKTYEKTFVKASATYVFFFIPVTVSGSISGSVGASLEGVGMAKSYLGIKNSLFSNGTSSQWTLSAGLAAHFSTCVGICGLLSVGIQGDINVFSLSVSPKAASGMGASLTGDAKYTYENVAPITLSTMNGRVYVWADYLVDRSTQEIVRWSGYSDTWTAWSHKGSITCADYRGRPSSDCRSYITN